MCDVFLHFANLSITASYLILAVLVLRLILRKVPKSLLLWLWALVGIRLALPVSLESSLSLIPKSDPIPADIALSPAPAIDSGVPVIDSTVNPIIGERFAPAAAASVNPMQIVLTAASALWLAGLAAMLLYTVFSYFRLARQVRASLRLEGNLYLCDAIATPFILGIWNPKIYLPSGLDPEHQTYVLRHERAHLRNHDNLWKPLGFLLLSVYWFNPLVWIGYALFCRDLEMACDERAVTGLDIEEKKAYSSALLACAAPRRAMAACPVAFGESSVKSRIRNVLRFKKASLWAAAAVLVITAAAAVFFLTNPREEDAAGTQSASAESAASEETGFTPLDGFYTYTNGALHLEFTKVSGVKTQTTQDAAGQEYTQTILLTEPGAVMTIVNPDLSDGRETWQLCEATGALGSIPVTDTLASANLVLSHNEYYLEDVRSDSRRVLLLKRRAEDPAAYVPATAADASAYDLVSGELLYSYQRLETVAPGHLNKLALALVVLENHDPEELVDTTALPAYLNNREVYQTAFPFSEPRLSLERMEQMTVEDLLTLMLIRGCDDAAYALARFDAGSEEAMVSKMNQYAESLCQDTFYTDLYGHAEGQYTTGADTMRLVSRMLQNDCLSRIWSTRSYTCRFPDNGEEYTVYTANYILDNATIPEFYDVRVTGGFAFFRGTASCICTARQDGKDVLCVILGAERKFQENGWQLESYGNFEEMCQLLNAVLG